MKSKNNGRQKKDMLSNEAPVCIGVIIDGNRRWAKERNLPVSEGHRAGYEKLKKMISWAHEEGIKNIIIYTFSTENWSRAKEEVKSLIEILRFALHNEFESVKKENARITIIGQLERFSADIRQKVKEIEEKTQYFTGPHVTFALSYGGRAEILSAVKKLSKEKTPQQLQQLTEKAFSSALWTKNIPDPELIIRTGGEFRLSNFLPWQSTYSELFFVKSYWPSFTHAQFKKILVDFAARTRRHGR